jgi:hypothetical protein
MTFVEEKMPKPPLVIPFFIVIGGIIACACLIYFGEKHRWSREISTSDYEELEKINKEYPELSWIINKCMSDNAITIQEAEEIIQEKLSIEKQKVKERIKESVKDKARDQWELEATTTSESG